MNYGLTDNPKLNTSECLVVGIFSDKPLPQFIASFDKKNRELMTLLSAKATEPGDALWQMDAQGHRLLIIQCGKRAEFSPVQLQKRLAEVTDSLIKHRIRSVTLCIPQLLNYTADWQLEQMITQINSRLYQFLEFRKKNAKPHQLESILFFMPGATQEIIPYALAVSAGVALARDLANMPASICTPAYLGEQAELLCTQYKKLSCTIMGPDELTKMGAGLLLAVSQGSEVPPRLIDIQYSGGNDAAPIILVGKGITFDSGGMSIKPAMGMEEMKYDMCGAASVLGTIKACAMLNLPVNVIGLISSAENMISGKAVKPGDIVTSLSGQTVEIINTDAEGRLVLADALTYAERYNPQFVLDIATLTGAMVVALGGVCTGFMTKDDALAQLISDASNRSGDKAWRMPLDDAYQDAIDSPLADMLNATFDRTAGSITAACFLSRFTEKYRWGHLDIAGSAWISGKKRDATGRPVPLLTQIIRYVANSR